MEFCRKKECKSASENNEYFFIFSDKSIAKTADDNLSSVTRALLSG